MTTVPSQPPPPPPPPPTQQTAKGGRSIPTNVSFSTVKGRRRHVHRVGVYGPGKIGKSTLASLAIAPRFIDLEGGTSELDVDRVRPPEAWTWALLRAALQSDAIWQDCRTVVIDTATRAEELCASYVLGVQPTPQNKTAESIEDYGFGKGYVYIYEEFLKLLGDLDSHVRAGRNVILLMHDCTTRVPNPVSEDYIRYEPRLQSPPAGKNSIRYRVREWLDHLLFLGYDLAVSKDGKPKGRGSRTIYPQELPWAMAGSRSLRDPMPFRAPDDMGLWALLFSDQYKNKE